MHLLHNEYIGGTQVGTNTTIAQYVLPPLLGSLSASFRRSTCPLLNEIPEIEAALQEHRIDLGLVGRVFRLPNLKYTTFLGMNW